MEAKESKRKYIMVSIELYNRFRLEVINYFAIKGYDDTKILTMLSHDGKIWMLSTFFTYEIHEEWMKDNDKYNTWFFEHIQPILNKYKLNKDDIEIKH